MNNIKEKLKEILLDSDVEDCKEAINEYCVKLFKIREKNIDEINILSEKVKKYNDEYTDYLKLVQNDKLSLNLTRKSLYVNLKDNIISNLKNESVRYEVFNIDTIIFKEKEKILIEYEGLTTDVYQKIEIYLRKLKFVNERHAAIKPDDKINNDNVKKINELIQENININSNLRDILLTLP